MSTAYYSQGMESYNNTVNPSNYTTWKGTGNQSYPVAVSSSNIRPLTNKDTGNVFPTGFGLARPIKHWRKGRVIPVQGASTINPDIQYNINRYTPSSRGASLGGGAGGMGQVTQWIGQPGSVSVKPNSHDEINETLENQKDCTLCQGVSGVVDYSPHQAYLTQNPQPQTETPTFCCNEERKALRRVIYAKTKLDKNYFTSTKQYLQNRCKTYDQRIFNFVDSVPVANQGNRFKPGSPQALSNTYVANCQPNGEISQVDEVQLIRIMVQIMQQKGIFSSNEVFDFIQAQITTLASFLQFINETLPPVSRPLAVSVYNLCLTNPSINSANALQGNLRQCKLVVYKPNNYQYAQQGAVSSSARMLKLNVSTIETNLAGYNRQAKIGVDLGFNSQVVNSSGQPVVPFLYKNKAVGCQAQTQIHFQNHKSCNNTPAQPTQSPLSTNHYAQSPVDALA